MSSPRPFDYKAPASNSVAQIRAEATRLGLQVPPRLNKSEMLTWLLSAAKPDTAPAPNPVKQSPPPRKSPTPVSSSRSSRTPTPTRRIPSPKGPWLQIALLLLFIFSVYNPYLGPLFFVLLVYWFVQEYRQHKF